MFVSSPGTIAIYDSLQILGKARWMGANINGEALLWSGENALCVVTEGRREMMGRVGRRSCPPAPASSLRSRQAQPLRAEGEGQWKMWRVVFW